ncbi:MAG: endonuclease/exonuclease/phosphatase family protein [Muribaculaceae bacterium]|nr:endonuclease/exonuclease/phosphatase family protein [Muribaculaceae bacterium]
MLRKKILSGISILVVTGFLLAGYFTGLDPRTWNLPVLFSMTFPLWLIAMIAMTVIAIAMHGRVAMLILLLGWAFGWVNVCAYSPWNRPREAAEGEQTFSLMTYNVYHFKNYNKDDSKSSSNATIQTIIDSGADIVALQECVSLESPNVAIEYTLAQFEDITKLYPYRQYQGCMGLLSRFPIETVELPEHPEGTAYFAAWKVFIPEKTTILYDVHLQSFGLDENDKEAYVDLIEGEVNKQVLKEARNALLPKVSRALKYHASEAMMLARDINLTSPDEPVIVCGDFNDIQGSFPVKEILNGCDMKDAWRTGALGPTYTYHGSRLYFNIDHILYRDFLKPLKTWRIKSGASDHYPIMTIFPID